MYFESYRLEKSMPPPPTYEHHDDVQSDEMEEVWKKLGKQPPGPFQTIKESREARKKSNSGKKR